MAKCGHENSKNPRRVILLYHYKKNNKEAYENGKYCINILYAIEHLNATEYGGLTEKKVFKLNLIVHLCLVYMTNINIIQFL